MDETIKTVMISFQEHGKNGGPYHSHKRIMESDLKERYKFEPFIVPRFRTLIKPKNAYNFVMKIRKINPDIIHFSGLQLEGFHVLVLCKIANRGKTVCAVRGSVKDTIYFNIFLKWLISKMEKWTLKHSDVCYGVSEYVANWDIMKNYAHWNYGSIYNFCNFEEPTNVKNDNLRHKLGIKPEDIVVISTGRITIEKGFELLSRIILTKKDWGNVKFIIVGDGDYKSEMEKIIQNSKLNKTVSFTGYQKNVVEYLNISDIYITCTMHETLGNSVIEASNSGLPIIATNTGGLSEIVIQNETGYLIRTGDVHGFCRALDKLVDDKILRCSFGNKGKKHIHCCFDKKKIENQLERLYTELIDN